MYIFFKDFPTIYREQDYETNEITVFRCNGTKKDLTTCQEIYDEYTSGEWKYYMEGRIVEGAQGALHVYRDIERSNASNCDFTRESATYETTSERVYKKTTSTGEFVRSTNPNEYPNDGYKNGIYTVKSTPR